MPLLRQNKIIDIKILWRTNLHAFQYNKQTTLSHQTIFLLHDAIDLCRDSCLLCLCLLHVSMNLGRACARRWVMRVKLVKGPILSLFVHIILIPCPLLNQLQASRWLLPLALVQSISKMDHPNLDSLNRLSRLPMRTRVSNMPLWMLWAVNWSITFMSNLSWTLNTCSNAKSYVSFINSISFYLLAKMKSIQSTWYLAQLDLDDLLKTL